MFDPAKNTLLTNNTIPKESQEIKPGTWLTPWITQTVDGDDTTVHLNTTTKDEAIKKWQISIEQSIEEWAMLGSTDLSVEMEYVGEVWRELWTHQTNNSYEVSIQDEVEQMWVVKTVHPPEPTSETDEPLEWLEDEKPRFGPNGGIIFYEYSKCGKWKRINYMEPQPPQGFQETVAICYERMID